MAEVLANLVCGPPLQAAVCSQELCPQVFYDITSRDELVVRLVANDTSTHKSCSAYQR